MVYIMSAEGPHETPIIDGVLMIPCYPYYVFAQKSVVCYTKRYVSRPSLSPFAQKEWFKIDKSTFIRDDRNLLYNKKIIIKPALSPELQNMEIELFPETKHVSAIQTASASASAIQIASASASTIQTASLLLRLRHTNSLHSPPTEGLRLVLHLQFLADRYKHYRSRLPCSSKTPSSPPNAHILMFSGCTNQQLPKLSYIR